MADIATKAAPSPTAVVSPAGPAPVDDGGFRNALLELAAASKGLNAAIDTPNGKRLDAAFWEKVAQAPSRTEVTKSFVALLGEQMKDESNIADLMRTAKNALSELMQATGVPDSPPDELTMLTLGNRVWEEILSASDVFLNFTEAADLKPRAGDSLPPPARAIGALATPGAVYLNPTTPAERVLAKVHANPEAYRQLSQQQRANPQVAIAALSAAKDWKLLSAVPAEVLYEPDFVLALAGRTKAHRLDLRTVSQLVQGDQSAVENVLQIFLQADPRVWTVMSADMQSIPKIALLHLRQCPASFHLLPPELQKLSEFIAEARALGISDTEMEFDFNPKMAAALTGNDATAAQDLVARFPRLLWLCKPEWKNDPTFIETALKGDYQVLQQMPGLDPLSDIGLLDYIYTFNDAADQAHDGDMDYLIHGFRPDSAQVARTLDALFPEALVEAVAHTPELLRAVSRDRQVAVAVDASHALHEAIAREEKNSKVADPPSYAKLARLKAILPASVFEDWDASARLIAEDTVQLSKWQDCHGGGIEATLEMCARVPLLSTRYPVLNEILTLQQDDPKAYTLLVGQLKQAGINQVQRFASLVQLRRILADQKPDGRPTVLMYYSRHDHNGAYDVHLGPVLSTVLPYFRVAYVEAADTSEASKRMQRIMKAPARVFIPASHGLRLSNEGGFDVRDAKTMAQFAPFIASDGVLVASSCLNGQGETRRASIVNAWSVALPGRDIIGATESYERFNLVLSDDKKTVVRVDYGTRELHPLESRSIKTYRASFTSSSDE